MNDLFGMRLESKEGWSEFRTTAVSKTGAELSVSAPPGGIASKPACDKEDFKIHYFLFNRGHNTFSRFCF